MEADEEERELGDLCAEILNNWNTPIYSEMEIVHQNPFSLHRLFTTAYDVEQAEEQPHSKPPNVDTKISEPKRKYKDLDRSIIPMLVADTFYDKLLGHSTDGIDIAALTCEVGDDAGTTTVSANKPKEAAQMSSVHENVNNTNS